MTSAQVKLTPGDNLDLIKKYVTGSCSASVVCQIQTYINMSFSLAFDRRDGEEKRGDEASGVLFLGKTQNKRGIRDIRDENNINDLTDIVPILPSIISRISPARNNKVINNC